MKLFDSEYKVVVSILLLFVFIIAYYEIRISYLDAQIRELRIEQRISIRERDDLDNKLNEKDAKYSKLRSILNDYFPEVYNNNTIKSALKDSSKIQITNCTNSTK